jgi:Trk K+ transport system NAD-binding subunit/Kef-type K+ transport system membrane component KefB
LNFAELALPLLTVGLIALASSSIGEAFSRWRLPLITGFLCTGILAGPDVLGVIPETALVRLRFIDQMALAFIAFAAGSELNLHEMRGSLKSIKWVTVGLVASTFTLTSTVVYFIGDLLPFMRDMPPTARIGVAILAGSVMVARSPSSAIAVVNELRARGPFTRMVLGVTVTMDVVVIVLFAFSSSAADALLTDIGINLWLVALVIGEVLVSIGLGFLAGKLIPLLLSAPKRRSVRAALLLVLGFLAFTFSATVREFTHQRWPFEVLLEPLLICMVAGFVVTNFTGYRTSFRKVLDDASPPVYTLFFTLAGASLALDVLASSWQIALALFFVRVFAIGVGSFTGGVVAGDPMRLNRINWMAFITQAGIGLGLSKEIAGEFPGWGDSLATLMIAVIALNQLVGPPFFKWALNIAGEARVRAGRRDLRGTPLAIVFGLDGQSLALARQLGAHGWQVKVATLDQERITEGPNGDAEVEIVHLGDLEPETLQAFGADKAEAFVTLLSDELNERVCELAFDRFGTRNVIVQSDDRTRWPRYTELGATIIDPATALVSLLDHFVRSPMATELLLGMGRDQDVAEIKLRNPDLDRVALRDLKLPLDTLVLSVSRNGASLISHGYTELALGDRVTLVGSPTSLEEVEVRFAG